MTGWQLVAGFMGSAFAVAVYLLTWHAVMHDPRLAQQTRGVLLVVTILMPLSIPAYGVWRLQRRVSGAAVGVAGAGDARWN